MFHTIVLAIATTETCIMFAIPLNQKREMRLVPEGLLLFISLLAAFLRYDLDEILGNLCSFFVLQTFPDYMQSHRCQEGKRKAIKIDNLEKQNYDQ